MARKIKQRTGEDFPNIRPEIRQNPRHGENHDGDAFSVPFLSQEKIPDIAVLDTVAAHVKLVEGDNIFGVIVPDTIVCPKLTLNGCIPASLLQVAASFDAYRHRRCPS